MISAVLQESADWLDPTLEARISCHEITWSDSRKPESIRTGGDLNFHVLPHSGTSPHTHDFAEILLVTDGALVHRVNAERQFLQTGHLLFIRPNDLHYFEPAGQAEKCEFVLLDFRLELFLTLSRYLENDAFLQQLTAPVLPPTFRLDAAATAELYGNLLRINSHYALPQLRKVKLKILLAELMTHYFLDEANRLSEAQVPDWLEELCAQMRKPENFIAGLGRMQRLACRTPEHLCKSFRRYLEKTPTDFINELRIAQAARWLTDTRDDIVVIAERLRFQSLSRFYHLFKKQYGLSPARFRQLYSAGKRI